MYVLLGMFVVDVSISFLVLHWFFTLILLVNKYNKTTFLVKMSLHQKTTTRKEGIFFKLWTKCVCINNIFSLPWCVNPCIPRWWPSRLLMWPPLAEAIETIVAAVQRLLFVPWSETAAAATDKRDFLRCSFSPKAVKLSPEKMIRHTLKWISHYTRELSSW